MYRAWLQKARLKLLSASKKTNPKELSGVRWLVWTKAKKIVDHLRNDDKYVGEKQR